jgi:H+/Cl- antiporter ClcA
MKIKKQTIKLVNGNQSFPTVAISERTVEEVATIVGVVAFVAAVLSLPIAIFVMTYGLIR